MLLNLPCVHSEVRNTEPFSLANRCIIFYKEDHDYRVVSVTAGRKLNLFTDSDELNCVTSKMHVMICSHARVSTSLVDQLHLFVPYLETIHIIS